MMKALLFATLAFGSVSYGETHYDIKMTNCKDCPVTILGLGSNGKADLLGHVVIGNNSEKNIDGVKFAWVLTDVTAKSGGVVQFSNNYKTSKFKPSDVIVVEDLGANSDDTFKKIDALSPAKGGIYVGVVQVTFSDGTVWNRQFDHDLRFSNDNKDFEVPLKFKENLLTVNQASVRALPGTVVAKSSSCITPEEAQKLVSKSTSNSGCPNTLVWVCNPGNKSCLPGSMGHCYTSQCLGYGCSSSCCQLNVCNGNIACYN